MRSTSATVSWSAAGVYAALTAQAVAMAAVALFEQVRGRRLAEQIAAFGGDPDAPGAYQVVGAATAFAILILAVALATLGAAAA